MKTLLLVWGIGTLTVVLFGGRALYRSREQGSRGAEDPFGLCSCAGEGHCRWCRAQERRAPGRRKPRGRRRLTMADESVTIGWLLHALARAEGIAIREGDAELSSYLRDQALLVLDLPGGEALPSELPRGMGADIAVALQRVLGAELSAELRGEVTTARRRALNLELARARAQE